MRIRQLFISALVVILLGGCATSKTPRKLKPGKPIPCPQKDC